MRAPRLYATFLLWMLTELFAHLPEVGDLDTPKLVFFFDEAHLLFTDAPKNLLTAIEQVVRVIRSKGVGVYFVTQNSARRAGHGAGPARQPRPARAARLHAARPKGGAAAAETFRQNKDFDTAEAIMQLGVGEALVSMLDAKGTPEMVDRALIAPPNARVGTITAEERQAAIENSPRYGEYDTPMDRKSAYRGAAKARRRAHGECRREARHAAASDDDAAPAPETAPRRPRRTAASSARSAAWSAACSRARTRSACRRANSPRARRCNRRRARSARRSAAR